jgi:hypothetical protein
MLLGGQNARPTHRCCGLGPGGGASAAIITDLCWRSRSLASTSDHLKCVTLLPRAPMFAAILRARRSHVTAHAYGET